MFTTGSVMFVSSRAHSLEAGGEMAIAHHASETRNAAGRNSDWARRIHSRPDNPVAAKKRVHRWKRKQHFPASGRHDRVSLGNGIDKSGVVHSRTDVGVDER